MKKLLFITFLFICSTGFGQRKVLIRNGEVVRVGMPDIFTRIDGTKVYGGYKNLPDSIHYVDGWRDGVLQEINPTLQKYGPWYYDVGNDVGTRQVIDLDLPDLVTAKEQKINELNVLVDDLYLSILAYFLNKKIRNEAIPAAAENKILDIETKRDLVINQINNLPTVEAILNYELPYEQIELMKEQLRAVR